jgi:hypothetical protein
MKYSASFFFSSALLCVASLSLQASADILETLDENLFYQSDNQAIQLELGGSFDLEGYDFPDKPVGFIHDRDGKGNHVRPRFTLLFDGFFGERLSTFAKMRWDDGLDPNFDRQILRLDEFFLKYSLVEDHLDVKVGRFAPVFGNWIGRHDPWQNPFITAPLPYDNVTSVLDMKPKSSSDEFASLRNYPDSVGTWLPVLWGPSYTEGFGFLGSYEKWDAAIEFKNKSLSSRPTVWNDHDWSEPTYTGRIGYQLSPAWNLGISGSLGPYMEEPASAFLPPSKEIGDFRQLTSGLDVSYAKQNLQVWAEFIFSRFEVPLAGDADVYSYYIEGKYKFSDQWFAGLRWSQQFYNEVNTSTGPQDWDNALYRVDASLGHRLDQNIQVKLQYSFQRQEADFQNGKHLLVSQVSIRF